MLHSMLDLAALGLATLHLAALPGLGGALPPGGAGLLPAVLAEGVVLVSWWKPLLLLPPILGWAWLVSKVFDKHAERFFLGRERWAAVHMVAGVGAFAAAVLIPVPQWWSFVVGYALMLLILAADIAAFVLITNKDEKVPEKHRLKLDMSTFAAASAAKKEAKAAGTVTLGIKTAMGVMLPPPKKETPEFEVRAEAEKLYITASDNRAAQIEIRPAKDGAYSVAHLIDGLLQPAGTMPAAQALAVIDFWKAAAGLDVADRRRRLQGKCTVLRSDVPSQLRVLTSGSQSGLTMTIAINPDAAVDRKAADLGLRDEQFEALKGVSLGEGSGIVLLAAPPLNGRTTTFYSVLRLHDAYTSNVQTVELEPQLSMEGIKTVKYEATADGPEFSTTVRSILRRDPDVLGVADLPDVETAKEIAKADTDRTRIYVSVKADGAMAAIEVWVKAVGDAAAAAKGLRGVVAQRVMRRLCENCKVAYQPPAEMLKKIGAEGKVSQLFKKGGQVLVRSKPETCPVCQGTGYLGQVAAFEVYPISAEDRTLIAEQNWNALKAELRKKKLPSIPQMAMRLAVDGATSIEEVTRITSSPAPASAAKPASKPQGKPPAAPAAPAPSST